MSLSAPSFTAIKNKYLLQQIHAFTKKEYSSENFDFYFAKGTNQVIYDTYISDKAERQVNLPGKVKRPLDELAAKKQWSAMSAGIKAARDEIAKLLQNDTLARFSTTPDGETAIGIATMGLDGPKAQQAKAFLGVYLKPRSPSDQYQAYQGLCKLASKSKVDPVLKAMDVPPPAKAPDDKAVIERNLKLDKLAKDFRKAMPQVLSYYASALSSLKKDGLPRDPEEVTRMFESGRMRHDKIHEPYTKAIQVDKAFTTKYKDVAALKKQIDDAWADYRRALEKR
jgi:hypothetical protein